MKSNSKTLGDIIKAVDERNSDEKTDEVLGISINKEFMPSVANIIGTDLSKYKLLRKSRFAFNSMHTGRDERLPIALFKRNDIAIVSPAYFMFEIKNKNEVDEDYLMIWFQRPEFDHICWYMTDASVRGGLSWDDFCRINIELPSIEEQRKIVHDYKVVSDRIELLKKINENLEEQIQTIFNEFFDGIFVNPNNKLGEYVECVLGGTPSRDETSYWNGDIPWINSGKVNEFRITCASEYITSDGLMHSSTKMMPKNTVVLAITGATLGQESITLIECCGNQSVIGILENKDTPYMFIHPFIKAAMHELLKKQTGGAQEHICKDDVLDISFNMPDSSLINVYTDKVKCIFELIESNSWELTKLNHMKDIMVSSLFKEVA